MTYLMQDVVDDFGITDHAHERVIDSRFAVVKNLGDAVSRISFIRRNQVGEMWKDYPGMSKILYDIAQFGTKNFSEGFNPKNSQEMASVQRTIECYHRGPLPLRQWVLGIHEGWQFEQVHESPALSFITDPCGNVVATTTPVEYSSIFKRLTNDVQVFRTSVITGNGTTQIEATFDKSVDCNELCGAFMDTSEWPDGDANPEEVLKDPISVGERFASCGGTPYRVTVREVVPGTLGATSLNYDLCNRVTVHGQIIDFTSHVGVAEDDKEYYRCGPTDQYDPDGIIAARSGAGLTLHVTERTSFGKPDAHKDEMYKGFGASTDRRLICSINE